MTRRPSKAQRRAALAEFMAGLPEPLELPPECDAPVEDRTNGGTAITSEPVTIEEDGRLLTGTDWTLPSDYDDDDTQHNRLPMLKGTTPLTLPTLADDDTTGSEPCESD